ncbi:MAG: fertility inhibition FinO-like protein [Pseudanabaena sp.]
MSVQGKLEVTIKINELPAISSKYKHGWVTFEIDCEGRIFSATVKPKVFKKLEDAQANFPMWVAAIAGKMGEATETGVVLLEPNIQVFEKKPKEAKPAELASPS